MLWPIPARGTIHLKTKKKQFKILSRGKCYRVVIQNQSIAWHVLVEIFGFSKIIHKTCFFSIASPLFVEIFGFSDIFHNKHDLFRTRDDDLSGRLKAVPRSYFGIDRTCQNSKRQEGNYSFQNEKNKIGWFGSAQQIYPQGLESKLWCQVTSVF